MCSIQVPRRSLLRRHFLQSGLSSIGLLLSICLLLSGCGGPLFEDVVGKVSEPLNQQEEALLFNPQKLAPEFSVSATEPDALLINTFDFTPQLDTTTFRLTINDEVNNPFSLSMAEIQNMPLTSMIR